MDTIAIVSGNLLTPERQFVPNDLLIVDGKIAMLGETGTLPIPPDVRRLDAQGDLVAPGFIDAHMHGGDGLDFMECTAEQADSILEWLPATGVTGVLPTLASSPLDEELAMLSVLREVIENPPAGAAILGIHLEGPYINPARRGAQPEKAIRPPSIREMEQLIEASGANIRLVTLAPELPGALELVRFLVSQGIVVSAGHSQASYEQVMTAVEAGLSRVAHLYNGMPPFNHRLPGIVGAALICDDIYAELILDGIHISAGAAELALRAKGLDRVVLVSDATQAAGLGDGVYIRPGNRKVIVKDGAARLESGALAGSALTQDRAVVNAGEMLDLSPAAALSLAGQTAAGSLGLGASKGTLAPGMDADILVLDPDLNILTTLVAGKVVYQASG
jgi:N-acetylglucosamine-6-phosphate deacetylase